VKNVAEFTLIGRLGAIKKVGSTLRLTIASNYSFKDANGNWQDDAHWNEVTIFSKATIKYVEQWLGKGDLVHARGRIRQNSYERDGQRVYTVDLICTEFSRLAQASDNRDDAEHREAEQKEDV
jgi:single-strand DNA-binding protein